jgi:hypothetical protein
MTCYKEILQSNSSLCIFLKYISLSLSEPSEDFSREKIQYN